MTPVPGISHFEIHPAAELFPPLSGEDYEKFKGDIGARGLLEPIWLYDGKVLDGRNRYRVCTDLGIEPATRQYIGDSPVAFVWSMNGARRQLEHGQLTAIAVNMLGPLQEEARKRQETTLLAGRDEHGNAIRASVPARVQGPNVGEAAEQAAHIVGVSSKSVYQAKVVKEHEPALFSEVAAGNIPVARAYKETKRKQREAAEAPARASDPELIVPRNQPREQRITDIRRLASEGHRSEQIAEKLQVGVGHVRDIARDSGITLPDAAFSRSAKIKVDRVIEETILNIEGCALGLQTIEESLSGIAPEQAGRWAESMTVPLKTLTKLRKTLLEIAR